MYISISGAEFIHLEQDIIIEQMTDPENIHNYCAP